MVLNRDNSYISDDGTRLKRNNKWRGPLTDLPRFSVPASLSSQFELQFLSFLVQLLCVLHSNSNICKIIEESPWQYDVSMEQLKRLKMQFCICVFVCFYLCICLFVYLYISICLFVFCICVFVSRRGLPVAACINIHAAAVEEFFFEEVEKSRSNSFHKRVHCFCQQSKANININVNFQTPSKIQDICL